MQIGDVGLAPSWVLWLVAVFIAWPVLGWVLVRTPYAWLRKLVAAIIFVVGLGAAWIIPPDLPALRFMVLIPFFAAIGKTLEFVSGKLRDPWIYDSPSRTLVWLMVLQRPVWPDTPQLHAEAKRQIVPVGLRAVGKALATLALMWLNSEVPLHENLWLSTLWMCFLMYFFFSGVVDLLGMPWRFFGLGLEEVFNAPPLARNPREFWSRRWNLWFSRAANLMIFQPLGGARRPILSVGAVFVFSALLHEYMTWVSLGIPDGRMTAFFLIHGVATLVTASVGRSLGRKTLMPHPLAVGLHIVWFVFTAPLFFGPIEEAFALSQWRLY